MNRETFVHENSYKGNDFISFSHRSRLGAIKRLLLRIGAATRSSWADFGCSNGFVIEQMVNTGRFRFSRITGFDHQRDLLGLARQKQIPNADFCHIDLNAPAADERRYELVTCFETLEHVGDYRAAFANVQQHLSDHGVLVIGVPNEVGLPGLIKFVGRSILRRDPYEGFFENAGARFRYLLSLISYGNIEKFRRRNQPGYGPHLGFDHREFFRHVEQTYLRTQRLTRVRRYASPLNMTVFYVFEK